MKHQEEEHDQVPARWRQIKSLQACKATGLIKVGRFKSAKGLLGKKDIQPALQVGLVLFSTVFLSLV